MSEHGNYLRDKDYKKVAEWVVHESDDPIGEIAYLLENLDKFAVLANKVNRLISVEYADLLEQLKNNQQQKEK